MPKFTQILYSFPLSVVVSAASVVLAGGIFITFLWPAEPSTSVPLASAAEHFPTILSLKDDAITAKAAIVYDPASGQMLYAKNPHVTLPLASLTKLMTAEVVLNTVPANTLITLSHKDVSVEGDAGDWNLKEGDTMRLSDVIKLGLTASSNHAMSAAAAALGSNYVDDLNHTAATLGLTHTYFLNSTGLDLTQDTSGAYGSAADIAKLAAAFMQEYPQYFEESTNETITVPVSGRKVTVAATALPLLDIPGLIGAKTGYTDLAGGNLVAAFDADVNHPLIAVVLGSTEEGRFEDIRTLIMAVRKAEK